MRSRPIVLLALLAAWLLTASPALASPTGAPKDDLVAQSRLVLELANAERVRAGLLPLKWNDELATAALAHASDMASRGYFAHSSPDGATPTDRAARAGYAPYGWGGLYVGENLARAYDSAVGAHRGWMDSPGHRANLLNPRYREMGAAVVRAPSGALVWAQEFGSRPDAVPVFIDNDAPVTESGRVTLSVGREEVSPWGSLGEVDAMMVSNRADFAGAAWEPYAPRKAWRLEGSGDTARVYVRLRDSSGHVVDSADEIALAGPVLGAGPSRGDGPVLGALGRAEPADLDGSQEDPGATDQEREAQGGQDGDQGAQEAGQG